MIINSRDVTKADLEEIAVQLGRPARGVVEISYRTPDGKPAVVMTRPRLNDGTPFPTLYYLTEPRLTAEASRLETMGVMKTMTRRIETDDRLRADYEAAHEHYLSVRNAMEDLGTNFSAGGMPTRVKCLHVLIAYALAEGPGRIRLGDEAVSLAGSHGNLFGSAIPQDWPRLKELGVGVEDLVEMPHDRNDGSAGSVPSRSEEMS